MAALAWMWQTPVGMIALLLSALLPAASAQPLGPFNPRCHPAELENLTEYDRKDAYSAIAEALWVGSGGRCLQPQLKPETRLADCGGLGPRAVDTLNRRLYLKGLPRDPYLKPEWMQEHPEATAQDLLLALADHWHRTHCEPAGR